MPNPWESADILVDRLGKPIPQIWDEDENKFIPYTDNYKGILDGSTPAAVRDLQIENQIMNVLSDFAIVKSTLTLIQGYVDGLETRLSERLDVSLSFNNTEIVSKTVLSWDGLLLAKTLEVPVSNTDILIYANNTCDQDLTVTLEHEVEEGVWVPYVNGNGIPIAFTIAALTGKGVYGVFQKFPKYLGGRIVFTAASAPTANGTTTVQVQEV